MHLASEGYIFLTNNDYRRNVTSKVFFFEEADRSRWKVFPSNQTTQKETHTAGENRCSSKHNSNFSDATMPRWLLCRKRPWGPNWGHKGLEIVRKLMAEMAKDLENVSIFAARLYQINYEIMEWNFWLKQPQPALMLQVTNLAAERATHTKRNRCGHFDFPLASQHHAPPSHLGQTRFFLGGHWFDFQKERGVRDHPMELWER